MTESACCGSHATGREHTPPATLHATHSIIIYHRQLQAAGTLLMQALFMTLLMQAVLMQAVLMDGLCMRGLFMHGGMLWKRNKTKAMERERGSNKDSGRQTKCRSEVVVALAWQRACLQETPCRTQGTHQRERVEATSCMALMPPNTPPLPLHRP